MRARLLTALLGVVVICGSLTTTRAVSSFNHLPGLSHAPDLPQLILLSEASEASDLGRLIPGNYLDMASFERDLDRIGPEMKVTLHRRSEWAKVQDGLERILREPGTERVMLASSFSSIQSDRSLNQLVRTALESGRTIYLYDYDGGISEAEVESVLGVILSDLKPVPDPEDREKRRSALAPAERHNMIGVTVRSGSITKRLARTDARHPYARADHIIRTIALWEVEKQEESSTPPDQAIVEEWIGFHDTFYQGPVLLGRLTADWYLRQNLTERSPNYDYFGIQPRYQVKTAFDIQGWGYSSLKSFLTEHGIYYQSDHVQDWGPSSTPSQKEFEVTLGLNDASATWKFATEGEVQLHTSADLDTDKVFYRFTGPGTWWGPDEWLGTPFHARPGTSWASTGTLAALNNWIQIEFVQHTPVGNIVRTRESGSVLFYDY